MASSLPGGFSSVQELMAEQRKRDEKLRNVFDWIDTDNSGTIEYEEFVAALKQLDASVNEEDIKKEWEIIDSDKSNAMEFQEFKRLMTAAFDKNDKKLGLQRVLSQKTIEMESNDEKEKEKEKDKENGSMSPNGDIVSPRRSGKRIVAPLSSRSLKKHNEKRKEWESKLKAIFNTIDNDNSGSIELDEMWQHVKNLNLNFTKNQLKKEFEFIDSNNTKSIEFDEFRKLMMLQYDSIYSNDNASFAFPSSMDDNDGNNGSNETNEDDSNDDDNDAVPRKHRQATTVIRNLSMNSIDETKEDLDFMAISENDDDNNNSHNNNNNNNDNQISIHSLSSSELQNWDCNQMSIYICKLFENEKYKSLFIENQIDGNKFLQYNRGKWKKVGVTDRNDVTKILTAVRKAKTKAPTKK